MNPNTLTTDTDQLINSLICENLNDEDYCQFHRTVLTQVSAAVKEERLCLPKRLYCQYKGFVELSCQIYRNVQTGKGTELPGAALIDMFRCYRTQAEEQYRMLCRLIVSAYHNTTIPEERETLNNLINDMHRLIEQTNS